MELLIYLNIAAVWMEPS